MSQPGANLEVEIKLALTSAADGASRLRKAGFQLTVPRAFEVNIVLDNEAQELRARSCLLRLRQVEEKVILTYKGPPNPGPHKSREEIELHLSNFEAASALFDRLRFKPVFRYEKYRTEYSLPDQTGVAMVDETPLGNFLELEGQAEWIDHQAVRLGFQISDYITESYGRLYQLNCEHLGIPATNMVFKEKT